MSENIKLIAAFPCVGYVFLVRNSETQENEICWTLDITENGEKQGVPVVINESNAGLSRLDGPARKLLMAEIAAQAKKGDFVVGGFLEFCKTLQESNNG